MNTFFAIIVKFYFLALLFTVNSIIYTFQFEKKNKTQQSSSHALLSCSNFIFAVIVALFFRLFFLNRGLRSWAEGWCCEGWCVQDEIDRVYLVYIMYLLLATNAMVRNTFNLCSGSSDRSR